MIGLFLAGCDKQQETTSSPPPSTKEENTKIPATLTAALDRLDEIVPQETKQALLNDSPSPDLKPLGMQLRNDWGLWQGSALKDYFASRGIGHADWITGAILEAWRQRLSTGSVDEDAVIAKYADIEKAWRKASEQGWDEPDEKGGREDISPNEREESQDPER